MKYIKKKTKNKLRILEQWVEIVIKNGNAVTTLYPPNDELREKGQAMDPPPDLVYRRLNFPRGVPKIYHWVVADPVARRYGGTAIQRMTFDTWLRVSAREEHRSDGHIGKTGEGSLPRPEERGECPCPVCTGSTLSPDPEL
jgi:hypothetical protein